MIFINGALTVDLFLYSSTAMLQQIDWEHTHSVGIFEEAQCPCSAIQSINWCNSCEFGRFGDVDEVGFEL